MDVAKAHEAEAHGGTHVVSLPTLALTLAALLVLTWVTYAVTWFDLGALNLFAALAIAGLKATLVALYFMHLRWDRPMNGVILLVSLGLLILFLGFAMVDTETYLPERIPGYAPEIQR